MAQLVTVGSFSSPAEAEIVRGALRLRGIESFLVGEMSVGNLWHLGVALGGVKLQVPQQDVDTAKTVIEAAHHAGSSPAEPAVALHCPRCGETTEPGFDVCWQCGASLAIPTDVGAAERPPEDRAAATPTDKKTVHGPVTHDAPATLGIETKKTYGGVTDYGDVLANRAWCAAALGLLTLLGGGAGYVYMPGLLSPPFLIYSAWVLLKIKREECPLSHRGKRRFFWATVITAAMLALYFWVIMVVLNSLT